ncbi:hypothetical protein GOP47_0007626 [Adiantum capillus-veneris]|uniref:Uncharacterized protein n=1 Tax=Adiantum capillus-veneris TaxID=13818 RepID=A0A9D4V2J2_ADICA|nr:hypothetical protein GOP47_0007626 [Adiantum capillus-veneris]
MFGCRGYIREACDGAHVGVWGGCDLGGGGGGAADPTGGGVDKVGGQGGDRQVGSARPPQASGY